MISVSDGQALLLCDNVLDMKPYHRYGGKITWEDSTRRAWLNGEFYESAFNKEEKNLIVLSEVVNEDHPDYGTDGGNNTKDHVVLLRSEEINRYMTDTNDLGAKASAYAIAKSIKVYASETPMIGCPNPLELTLMRVLLHGGCVLRELTPAKQEYGSVLCLTPFLANL